MNGTKLLALGAVVLGMMTGCSPQVEPVALTIQQNEFAVLELVSEELVPNCGASYGIPCQQPLYSVYFSAGPEVEPRDVCIDVIEFQSEIGLDTYASDQDLEVIPAGDIDEIVDFCAEGFDRDLSSDEGPDYYRGTALNEDGSDDGVAKFAIITRKEDGSYFVDFTVSRDLERMGSW
jgi:hypothetical protein